MMPIETVRVSKQARDQLSKVKRLTGIGQWNILCRWAFCISIAEPDPPHSHHILADSNVEMSWRTFAGEHEGLYLSLLKQRCRKDGFEIDEKTLATQFRLHLHRGIGHLAGSRKFRSITDLVELGTCPNSPW